jgi:lipoprotein-releasing system permease protein
MRQPLSWVLFRKFVGIKSGKSGLITSLSIAAVAISIAVMIVASSLIHGFKEEISRKVFGFWGHIHITDISSTLSFEPKPIDKNQSWLDSVSRVESIPYQKEEYIFGTPWRVKDMETRGGVRSVQPFAFKPAILKTRTEIEGILIKGISSGYDSLNFKNFLLEGRLPLRIGDSTKKEIVLSIQTANRIQVKTGSNIILYFIQNGEQIQKRFQVVGLYKTGLEEYDRKFAYASLSTVQELLNWGSDKVTGFEIVLENALDAPVYTEWLYREVLPQELFPESIRDRYPAIFQWLELQDYNEWVILGLMLLVSLVNMITLSIILMLDRTYMIGLFKALGARNNLLRKIFLWMAMRILIFGVVLGNIIGFLLCEIQRRFHVVKLSEADYYLSEAPISYDLVFLLGLNIGVVFIIILFLWLPTRLILRISPIKTLKFR